jgi:probable phosphoglycerate mutase
VRHGETEWSLSRQHTGTTDIPLTDDGKRHAEALGARLAGRSFDLVLTSPLSRAIETCRLAGLGDSAEINDDLREWDYGEYEGVTTADIRKSDPGWDLWRDGCPGGENAAQVGVRADRVLARLRGLDGSAAIFAHGHLLRVLTARWIEQPPELGGRLALSTGTIGVLGWERETAVVWRWNDGAHLEETA